LQLQAVTFQTYTESSLDFLSAPPEKTARIVIRMIIPAMIEPEA